MPEQQGVPTASGSGERAALIRGGAPGGRALFPEDSALNGSFSSASAAAPEKRRQGPACAAASPEEGELQRLRALLFAEELALLRDLKKRLDDPAIQAREISAVIAEALLLRAGKDERLSLALEPVVQDIVKTSLRTNPTDFVNSIFPLMGPAIRRSISETFRSMLQGFSKSIELSFSLKGLKWRLEALRAGKPYSEIVLLHTLVYRVEQVLFIHSETGLVLAHAVNEGVESQDADMVSAMFTAIQDFVRDSFARDKEGELESLQYGDLTIFVEKNARAYLACIVRGTPPVSFRQQLREYFELMLIESAPALADFNGDTAPFLGIQRYLDACLVARFVDEDKPLPFWAKALPVLALLLLAGGAGAWQYTARERAVQETLRREAAVARLQAGIDLLQQEPGILLVNLQESESPPWNVVCLKDEIARSPWSVLKQTGYSPQDFNLTVVPHVSYENSIVTRRVRRKILPPETVAMRFEDNGTLYLSGSAPMDWILRVRQEALAIPGVKAVDTTKLADPRIEQLQELVSRVEGTVVFFPLGKDRPVQEDVPKLEQAVSDLAALEALAAEMGLAVSLTVYGHADAVGSDVRNYEISQARTKTIAAMLYAKGAHIPVSLYGMGAEHASRNPDALLGEPSGRRIELRVHLSNAAQPSLGQVLH